MVPSRMPGVRVGGAVNGGPGRGTVYYTRACMWAPPLSDELLFLIGFSFPLFKARPEADGSDPRALTMMALTKQFGTRREEDAGELGVLPDHVHCGQNSLRKPRASDRATTLESTLPPHRDRVLERYPPTSHLLPHIGAGLQKQLFHLGG